MSRLFQKTDVPLLWTMWQEQNFNYLGLLRRLRISTLECSFYKITLNMINKHRKLQMILGPCYPRMGRDIVIRRLRSCGIKSYRVVVYCQSTTVAETPGCNGLHSTVQSCFRCFRCFRCKDSVSTFQYRPQILNYCSIGRQRASDVVMNVTLTPDC